MNDRYIWEHRIRRSGLLLVDVLILLAAMMAMGGTLILAVILIAKALDFVV